jgi:hypothetical protein
MAPPLLAIPECPFWFGFEKQSHDTSISLVRDTVTAIFIESTPDGLCGSVLWATNGVRVLVDDHTDRGAGETATRGK